MDIDKSIGVRISKVENGWIIGLEWETSVMGQANSATFVAASFQETLRIFKAEVLEYFDEVE